MNLRAALAALDDAALEAAASKGLVRRAHRDNEAGLAAVTREAPEAIDIVVDGATVSLGAAGLSAARCSCPAQGVCRHILTAIIALRRPAAVEDDEPVRDNGDADPLAELAAVSAADLVEAFGRAALREAEALLAAAAEVPEAISIEVAARACVVRLPGQPEVRYLAGLGLAGMIAKEPAPIARPGARAAKRVSAPALRAAAALAARRRHTGEVAPIPSPAAPSPAAPTPAARQADTTFLDDVTDALAEAARVGLATPPLLVEERLLDLALSSRADAMPRLAGALRGIAEDLSKRRARAAAFEPAAALAAVARTYALVLALRGAGDDPALRGTVRQPYAECGTLELVGCGLEIWRTPVGARGATAYALAPERAELGWVTLTLARAAGQDPFFAPLQAVFSEPVWGRSLERLAGARFRLDGARATAARRLSLGNDTRLTPQEGGLADLLATRPDLAIEDWAEIPRRVAPHLSPALRAEVRAVPLALRPAAIDQVQFDPIAQRAWLPAMDRAGHWLDLTIGVDPDDTRLDAITAMLAKGRPHVLVTIATRRGATLTLSPIAALADAGAELQSFDLWQPPPRRTTRGSPIDRPIESPARAFVPAGRHDAAAALLARAEDEVLALAELGGRMEDRARLARLGRLASDLDAAGLSPLAALLSRLATSPTRERPLRLLAVVHAAASNAGLSPRLPLVQRVR